MGVPGMNHLDFQEFEDQTETEVSRFYRGLDFTLVETYSFNRGKLRENWRNGMEAEISGLKNLYRTARYMERAKISQELDRLEHECTIHAARIVTESGEIHPTAEKTGSFNRDSPQIAMLSKWMLAEEVQSVATGCIPIYRDALVFRDAQNNICGSLNICFPGLPLHSPSMGMMSFGDNLYRNLKAWLLSIGHPIESDRYFE